MPEKDFKDQIEEELNKLNREQIIRFAWLCAVRALPFSGSQGHFNSWKTNERKKHIYAQFNAIDTVSFIIYAAPNSASSLDGVAYATANSAYNAAHSANINASAYAVYAAANAANTAAAANDIYAVANATYAAANANAAANDATANDAYFINSKNKIESILLHLIFRASRV